ncbi:Golgi-associated kinase 1B [Denticeps clupeoides]|uniref:Uncharacterized protein n=1 Tax=Denticeps clupeoides TaxID=299321 RepID=A0AAY4DGW5_9TELE|nr:Golgi-associated kinase 1B [Denticeps clupeoides]
MEPRPPQPAGVSFALLRWSCYSFSRISGCLRRSRAARRNVVVAAACCVYLLFALHQVGQTALPGEGRARSGHHRTGRGVGRIHESSNDRSGTWDPQKTRGRGGDALLATRSNVVYITLKSKRMKPAVIRGTVRPKLRRKVGRTRAPGDVGAEGRAGGVNGTYRTAAGDAGLDIKAVRDAGDNPAGSSIRVYSDKAPPWFSRGDIDAMRFLADAAITRVENVESVGSFLLFQSPAGGAPVVGNNRTDDGDLCPGRCGVVKGPVDLSEVFAFHLDRVLRLNMSLPAVARRFHVRGGSRPCPIVLWDSSLSPVGREAWPGQPITWGSYQSILKHKCWHRGVVPKPHWECPDIHHFEWSKLALFDFLLQVYERLDRNCCGFRPRPEDSCVELGHHKGCSDQDSAELVNIAHRKHDRRHLVFVNNKGFFDRAEDNLDFKLLEGIKELPDRAITVLSSQRLRERLLQSLFLDQLYWESQGGRYGIEKLIDVIEGRAKVLLTYINAHGVKVIPMNT